MRQLWTEVSIEKKQREDLQLRLSSKKEELEAEFVAEREELEADYQKQVDDMYFFGYHCCMKKHGIKRDVPSIPPMRAFLFVIFTAIFFLYLVVQRPLYTTSQILIKHIFHICTCLFLSLVILF